MGFARVELRCPRALDPRPSWTLGDVLAELDALDATRRAAPPTPLKQPPDWASDGSARQKAFVMRVDDEDDSDDEDDISDGESQALVATGARFSCNDLESSDSDDESGGRVAPYLLMEKRNLEKSILLELEREHHLKVQEEVRSKLSALEACHQNEIQRTISAFARLQKYAESRKEIDRRLDVHFQRRMYVLHCNFVSLRMPKKNYICFTEQHLRLSISSTILSICIRSKLHSSRLSFC
jgi:nucleoporin GLE1